MYDGKKIIGYAVVFVLLLLIYAFSAFSLQALAKKTGKKGAWMAWVPLLHLLLTLRIASISAWWIFLFLIPGANFMFWIYVWKVIAELMKRPHPVLIGFLMMIPGVQQLVLADLAFF